MHLVMLTLVHKSFCKTLTWLLHCNIINGVCLGQENTLHITSLIATLSKTFPLIHLSVIPTYHRYHNVLLF